MRKYALDCSQRACTCHGWCCSDGVDDVRAEVRKRAAESADLIKVMATGGFMTPGSHPSQARLTQEEMNAIADETKKSIFASLRMPLAPKELSVSQMPSLTR